MPGTALAQLEGNRDAENSWASSNAQFRAMQRLSWPLYCMVQRLLLPTFAPCLFSLRLLLVLCLFVRSFVRSYVCIELRASGFVSVRKHFPLHFATAVVLCECRHEMSGAEGETAVCLY